MNVNLNLPAVANLLGANPLMTPEQAQSVRNLLNLEETVLANLNADITEMSLLLERLTRDRNALQESVVGRPGSQTAALRAVIEEQESELVRLQDEHYATRAHLAHLDPSQEEMEIEQTQALLDGQIRQMDGVRGLLDSHRNMLSPIRRLPVEVLSEVFRWAMPADPYVSPKPRNAPLILTMICSGWRRLALSSPFLWSSLYVVLKPKVCRPAPPLVEIWLQRSANTLLSFSIDEKMQKSDLEGSGDTLMTCKKMLSYFAPYCSRWRRVQLAYIDWEMSSGLDIIPAHDKLPALKVLDLHREYWVPAETRELCELLAAPNLHDFTWYSRSAPIRPLSVIPASQLTRLHISRPVTGDDYFDIISRYPLLMDLQIYVQLVGRALGNPNAVQDTTMLQLPYLEELALTVDTSVASLFDRLTARALETLRITRLDEYLLIDPLAVPIFWSQTEVTEFLLRSGCNLRTFEVRDGEMTGDEVVQMLGLEACGGLENLVVSNERSVVQSVSDGVIEALTPRRGQGQGGYLCPNLVSIKLWRCVEARDGLLSEMIEQRWAPSDGLRPLRSAIVLLTNEGTNPRDAARLKELHIQRTGITFVRG